MRLSELSPVIGDEAVKSVQTRLDNMRMTDLAALVAIDNEAERDGSEAERVLVATEDVLMVFSPYERSPAGAARYEPPHRWSDVRPRWHMNQTRYVVHVGDREYRVGTLAPEVAVAVAWDGLVRPLIAAAEQDARITCDDCGALIPDGAAYLHGDRVAERSGNSWRPEKLGAPMRVHLEHGGDPHFQHFERAEPERRRTV